MDILHLGVVYKRFNHIHSGIDIWCKTYFYYKQLLCLQTHTYIVFPSSDYVQ